MTRRRLVDPDRQTGGVLAPVADHRPAEIGARCQDIDLVAAARPVLVHPDGAGLGMDRHALRVAMAVGENLGQHIVTADERIVVGQAAIGMQPEHAAGVVVELLGERPLAPIAMRDEQITVGIEHQPRAEMPAAAAEPVGAKDHLDITERSFAQPATRHRRPGTASRRLVGEVGIAQIDQAVGREIRVQRHIEQPALAT